MKCYGGDHKPYSALRRKVVDLHQAGVMETRTSPVSVGTLEGLSQEKDSKSPAVRSDIDEERIHTCGQRSGHVDVMLNCGHCKLPVVASACSKSSQCHLHVSHSRIVSAPTKHALAQQHER